MLLFTFLCFFICLLFAVVAAKVVGRPFPGACQIPKNGSQFPTRPLTLLPQIGHFVLCYTFYEMKQGAMRSPFPLNWRVPLEKTSHSLFNLFYLFLSNHWPSINSISLCSTEDIWRQRDTAQCIVTMQLDKKEISVLFSFILTYFYQDEIILCYLNFCCLHQFIAFCVR